METKDVIAFLNQFPGVKAELVAATGVKITSINFIGHVLYETTKGGVDASNVKKAGYDVDKELYELAEYSKTKPVPVMLILQSMYNHEMIAQIMLRIDNSKVLQLPF